MKSFIRFFVLALVSGLVMALVMTLPFSVLALITFIGSVFGTVVGLIGSLVTMSEAYTELSNRINSAKNTVVEHICRALDIKIASYYGNYSSNDIARYLMSTGQEHIDVTISLPRRWDYQIALPLVKYKVRKYIRDQKKQEAFVQKTKEVKVKL